MTIELWSLGKENNKRMDEAITEYTKRINRYQAFKMVNIDNTKINKNTPMEQLLAREADLITQKLTDRDLLIALDDKGKAFTSVQFAEKLNQTMNLSPQRIIFLIGGSYGIAQSLKEKSHFLLSLSTFTFPHQLVRLLFSEQLYRAFTILKNEKYHHE
ncbi:MAG: 23S rRNA (pseudouridine(1915)-N(3))-methyltransferase RlmH [Bacteroidetes bacterium]|nr:23S rRNA (pseudouridine(1915)-N(3))-methyltransferase RlmH [Bacteroidota bacterium]MBK6819813.1 23S rRNA (pseudouridine(1915)-N(3))-methyltransferase RlmH [Bacteroidota bacterium]